MTTWYIDMLSALLIPCKENLHWRVVSLAKLVMRRFDVYAVVSLNKVLNK